MAPASQAGTTGVQLSSTARDKLLIYLTYVQELNFVLIFSEIGKMISDKNDIPIEKSFLVCLETDIQKDRLSDPSDAEKWNFYEFEDFDTVD